MSVPTQAVDDDVTEVTPLLHNIREQRESLLSQKDKMDSDTYKNYLQNLEKIRARKKATKLQGQLVDDDIDQMLNELTLKCANLTKQMETLKAKALHCKCDSNLLCQKSREEKESLDQQLLNFGHLYLQEVEQGAKPRHLYLQEVDQGAKLRHPYLQEVAIDQGTKLRTYILSPSCPTGARYPMSKTPHGKAVIIANSKFVPTTPTNKLLPNSRGTEIDVKNLCATWKHLHYDVYVLRNLAASELLDHLTEIGSVSHENYDSFVCCIVSHGCLDGVYGSDGEIVKISDIANLFKHTPTLAHKPKLFFIYTYSYNYSAGKEVAGIASQCEAAKNLCHYLPNETDFLFSCSINMSWQNRSKYISVFYEVTKRYAARDHLLILLSIINYKMLEGNSHQGCEPDCCPVFNVIPLHKEVWFLKDS